MRLPVQLCPTRLFATSAKQPKVETYPRPVKHLRNYVRKEDCVHDFGRFKLFRARPDHIPLLIPTLQDFIKSEPTSQGTGLLEASADFLWPFLFNATRYPFTYFALNQADEVVSLALQNVVYKDNSQDPLPQAEICLSNPRDPFHLVGAVLGYAESRHFELLAVDRYIHNEIAYTPSSLRRQKISSTLYPLVMRLTAAEATRRGLQYSVGVVTGQASFKGAMAKLNYSFPETVPQHVYKDLDGKSWKPARDEVATLCCLDLYVAHNNRVFG